MRVLGIVRVSSKAQAEDDRYSSRNQTEKIANYCQNQGWNLIRTLEYVQSGARNQRELREILDISKRDSAEVVVVYELDRLARNMVSTLLFVDELRKHGIRFAAVENEINLTTPEGELQFHLLSAFAHYFRQQLGRKVYANQALRVREGKVFGRAKYGYRIGPNGRLVVDEDESAVVRQVYNWYLDEAIGLRELAKRLNEMGVRTKTGTQWGVSSIRLLFRDVETYRGTVTYGKWRKERGSGVWPRTVRNEGSYLAVDNAHPRILDEETIERALQRRQARSGMQGRAASSPHLLSGILYCGHCGARMVYSTSGVWSYYVCGSYARRGMCQRNGIRADIIEEAVIDDLSQVFEMRDNQLEIRREVQKTSQQAVVAQKEIASLEHKIANLPEMLRRARLALVEGAFTMAEYRATVADAEAEARNWRERITVLQEDLSKKIDPDAARAKIVAAIGSRHLDPKEPSVRAVVQDSYARMVYKNDGDPPLTLFYAQRI